MGWGGVRHLILTLVLITWHTDHFPGNVCNRRIPRFKTGFIGFIVLRRYIKISHTNFTMKNWCEKKNDNNKSQWITNKLEKNASIMNKEERLIQLLHPRTTCLKNCYSQQIDDTNAKIKCNAAVMSLVKLCFYGIYRTCCLSMPCLQIHLTFIMRINFTS